MRKRYTALLLFAIALIAGADVDVFSQDDLPDVPSTVKCYAKLVARLKKDGASPSSAELDESSKQMHSEQAQEETDLEHLQQQLEREGMTVKQLQAKINATTSGVLNVHKLAKAALGKYNDFTKNASLDETQSQQAMTAFLRYKKSELQIRDAEEDLGKDPNENSTYNDFGTKAQGYLDTYNAIEARIQDASDQAGKEKKRYDALLAQHQELDLESQKLKLKLQSKQTALHFTDQAAQHEEQELQNTSLKVNHTKSLLETKHIEAKHAKMNSDELKAEDHRVHKKWYEFKKKETYYGALRLEVAEHVTKIQSDLLKLSEEIEELTQHVQKHRRLKLLYTEKYNATDAAQRAFSAAFKGRGCGLLPHQIAEQKAQREELAKLKMASNEATEVALQKFSALQSLEDTNEYSAGDTDPLAANDALLLVELGDSDTENSGQPSTDGSLDTIVPDAAGAASENKECAHDRQMGEMNFNAAEQARTQMQRYAAKDADYSAQKARVVAAADSTRQQLNQLKAKGKDYVAKQALAVRLQKMPCGNSSASEEWFNALHPNSK
jgi:hypothetical protein